MSLLLLFCCLSFFICITYFLMHIASNYTRIIFWNLFYWSNSIMQESKTSYKWCSRISLMHRDSVKDVIIMRMFMLSTDVRTFYNLELRSRKIHLIVVLYVFSVDCRACQQHRHLKNTVFSYLNFNSIRNKLADLDEAVEDIDI